MMRRTERTNPAPDVESDLGPLPETLRRNQPLVPADSVAGRALVTVIAILTFLAALAAGAAELVASASAEWRSSISREITIQVKPNAQRDIEADVAAAVAVAGADPQVDSVSVYSKEEAERLLAPWLGTGLELVELPVPRLVVVRLKSDTTPDLTAMKQQLAEQVPTASLDDHRTWIARLSTMASTLVIIALAIVGLVLTAAALAIAFATRAALNELIPSCSKILPHSSVTTTTCVPPPPPPRKDRLDSEPVAALRTVQVTDIR